MSSTTRQVRRAEPTAPMPILAGLHRAPDECHIFLPPGIGEWLWVHAKTQHLTTPVRYWFTMHEPRRAHSICEMLGCRWGYAGEVDTDWLLKEFSGEVEVCNLRPGVFQFMHINRHLEAGRRLTEWMPDLPYANPLTTGWRAGRTGDYAVVHMCSEAYSEGNLTPYEWSVILREIERTYLPVSLVGALWDMPFAIEVMKHYRPHGPLLLARPFAEVARHIQKAKAMIALNSGLAIMATYMGVPTLEGYPTWLFPLAKAWPTEDVQLARYWCPVVDIGIEYGRFLETTI